MYNLFERLNLETKFYNNFRKGASCNKPIKEKEQPKKIAYDTLDECPVGGSAWYLAKINREIANNNF